MSRITGQVRIVGAGLLGASIGHALVMRGVDVILHLSLIHIEMCIRDSPQATQP